MLLKACPILVAIVVSVWADQECDIRAQEECIPGNLPLDYPETVEELIRDCNIVQETGRCFVRFYENNCPEQEDDAKKIEKMVKYMEAECTEDSHIFQVISRNIDCATPAARSLHEACSWENFSDDEIDNLIALLQPLWNKRIFECPSAVERITCASHVISKRCGSELKDVVANILENTQITYDECNDEYLGELLPFKAYFRTLLLKEEIFEDTPSDEE